LRIERHSAANRPNVRWPTAVPAHRIVDGVEVVDVCLNDHRQGVGEGLPGVLKRGFLGTLNIELKQKGRL
jgi:hypothetical protein